MIAVTQERENIYTIDVQQPELAWLIQAAKAMGMDRCSILGASFAKGLEHYFDMIREIEAHDNKKPTSEAKDHETYGKGPCQG